MKLYLMIIVTLLSACSEKQRTYHGPTGQVLLAYAPSTSSVASINLRISALEFIDNNGQLIRTQKIAKGLDLAIDEPAFLKTFDLPVGEYKELRLHISLEDSKLKVYDSEPDQWIDAQMISNDLLFVPQAKSAYVVTVKLDKTLEIAPSASHFLMLNFLMDETVSAATTFENYLLFHPTLSIKSSQEIPITGVFHSLDNDGNLHIISDNQVITTRVTDWSLNGTTLIESLDTSAFTGQSVKLSAILIDEGSQHIQAKANIITRPLYTGFLIYTEQGMGIIGHQFNEQTGPVFVSNLPLLSSGTATLYSEHEIAISADQLAPGQRVNAYIDDTNTEIHLISTQLIAEVISIGDMTEVRPLSIEGKDARQFYKRNLFVETANDTHINPGDLVTFNGYFMQNVSSDFMAIQHQTLNRNSIKLGMDFSIFNEAIMMYETNDEGNTVLFFLDSLEGVKIHPMIDGTLLTTDFSMDELLLLPNTQFTLKQVSDDTEISQSYTPFTEFIEALTPLLSEQKFLKLYANGSIINDRFEVHTLNLSLQTAYLFEEEEIGTEPNIVSNLQETNEDDKKNINENKVPIAAIVGGAVGGIALASGLITGSYYRYKNISLQNLSRYGFGYTKVYNGWGKTKFTVFHGTLNLEVDKTFLARLHALPSDSSRIIHIGVGDYFIDADTGQVLPWKFKNGDWVPSNPPVWSDEQTDHLGFKENIKIATADNGTLIRITLPEGNRLYLKRDFTWSSFDHKNAVKAINTFLTTTPRNKRQKFYFGEITGGNGGITIKAALEDPIPFREPLSFKTSKPVATVMNESRPLPYRSDIADRDTTGPFKGWLSIPDEAFIKTINDEANKAFFDKEYPDRTGKGPDELRVLIQLQNDEYAINETVYRRFMRYPEHSIVVQMNNNGDFRIINGANNLDKFTDPKYADKLVWEPSGHGWEYRHGANTVSNLTKNLNNLINDLPGYAKQLYPLKTGRNLAGNIAVKPAHINMDGCLLGRSRWSAQSFMHRFGNKFYKQTGLNPLIEGFAVEITTGNNINARPADSTFNTEDVHRIFKAGVDKKPHPAPSYGVDAQGHTTYDYNGKRRRVFRGPEKTESESANP